MSKTLTYDPSKDEPTDYEAATVECIKKIDELHEEIENSENESARLREETWVVLNRLEKIAA